MLFLISPAKSQNYETPALHLPHTQPLFVRQSTQLIKLLVKKSPRQISKLMDLSDDLSNLNVARYKAWSPEFTVDNAKQAALAFNGDVWRAGCENPLIRRPGVGAGTCLHVEWPTACCAPWT